MFDGGWFRGGWVRIVSGMGNQLIGLAAGAGAAARMPVVFVPHGGGPWPFVDLGMGADEHAALAGYLRSLPALLPRPARAVVCISAHFEAAVPTVTSAAQPPLLFDYFGFPPESYQLTWPAPGQPQLAARVQALLGGAGIESAADGQRGFDHGTFVPLKLVYPQADVPTVQLSLKSGLDPAAHLAIGRALAPLRDEGVLIIGSGMSFHNLRGFRSPALRPVAEEFDAWLGRTMALDPAARSQQLATWATAPSARLAHPREEHLLPLMVATGAAGSDPATVAYHGTVWGMRLSAFHFGG